MKKNIKMNLKFFNEETSNAETNETTTEEINEKENIVGDEEKSTINEVKESSTENIMTEDKIQKMLREETQKIINEALKLSNMTEDERKKHDEEEKIKSLEEREIAISLKELKLETESLLIKDKLSKDLTGFVMGKDLESTKNNIKMFKETFDKAVQEQVEKRLIGKSPTTSNGVNNSVDKARDEIRKGLRGI